MAAIAAIPGAIQAGTGLFQAARGRKMARGLEDPEMPIPQGALDYVNLLRTQASSRQMPGYENLMNELGQIMAGTGYQVGQAATSPSQALGAITQAAATQQGAMNQYAGQAAQDYQNRQAQYAQGLQYLGNLQQAKWENDVLNPFLRQANAAAAMAGAGMQNAFAGISDIAGSAAYGMMLKNEQRPKGVGLEGYYEPNIGPIEQKGPSVLQIPPSQQSNMPGYSPSVPAFAKQTEALYDPNLYPPRPYNRQAITPPFSPVSPDFTPFTASVMQTNNGMFTPPAQAMYQSLYDSIFGGN